MAVVRPKPSPARQVQYGHGAYVGASLGVSLFALGFLALTAAFLCSGNTHFTATFKRTFKVLSLYAAAPISGLAFLYGLGCEAIEVNRHCQHQPSLYEE